MKKILLFSLIVGFACGVEADLLLRDLFDDGNLGTTGAGDGQLNGGFNVIGSGGIATETANRATLANAPTGSKFGILSGGTFSLGSFEGIKTTWVVTDSSLKNNAESLVLTWQAGSDFENTPAVALILDLTTSDPTARFEINGLVATNLNMSASFGATNDIFSIVATFTPASYGVGGSGSLKEPGGATLDFSNTWTTPGLDSIRVGAYVNGRGNDGLVVEFDSVTVEAIPEPAVATLIFLSGGGILLIRRLIHR